MVTAQHSTALRESIPTWRCLKLANSIQNSSSRLNIIAAASSSCPALASCSAAESSRHELLQ